MQQQKTPAEAGVSQMRNGDGLQAILRTRVLWVETPTIHVTVILLAGGKLFAICSAFVVIPGKNALALVINLTLALVTDSLYFPIH